MADQPEIIVIAGPTASGKTALGIVVAERLGGEIISADSMQFYRGMEIGAAAPTAAELARVKHHFVSCIAPDEQMAAGEFQRRARELVEELHAAGKRVVVVGGSGLYINALIDGLFDGPVRQPDVRARLHAEAERIGNAAMLARLNEIDPEYAAQMTGENDLIRIVRALEVYETTGSTFSELHAVHQTESRPLPARFFGLQWDRAALYERINRRVLRMIEEGWMDEVKRLIAGGYGRELERLKALGYRELTAHLRGEQSLDAAIARTQMHHRRYAKRQLTWFRHDPRVHWLPASGAPGEAEALAEQIVLATCSVNPS